MPTLHQLSSRANIVPVGRQQHSLPACSHKHHCTWFHRLCSNKDFDIISIAFAASEISTSYLSPLQHQGLQHHTHRLCSIRDFNIIHTAFETPEISTSYPPPLQHQRFQHRTHRLCNIRDFNIVHIAFAAPEISKSYTSPLQHQRFQNHTHRLCSTRDFSLISRVQIERNMSKICLFLGGKTVRRTNKV